MRPFVLLAILSSACAASKTAGDNNNNNPPGLDGGTSADSPSGGGGGDDGGGGGGGDASGSGSSVAPGVTTLVVEPDDGLTAIDDLVSSAHTSIDMTMYELVDTHMTSLLTTAAGAGVTVRVILDQNLEKSSNETAYKALQNGGVSVHWANPSYSATHQKTITVDRKTSAVMSLNLVSEDYSTTRDFAVITTDATDVAAIETTFGDDFSNSSITPPTGSNLVWSPTNAQSSMLAVIAGAHDTLIVENEEMSDTAIVSALSAAAARGVTVKVAMTDSSSWSSEFKSLSNAGVKIATYSANASLYIHAKVIVADGATAFVGSENFSSASLTENRELGLVTTDAAIVSKIATVLASDFAGGTAY